ncbi:alpha amylase C-terminal domain-containing protein, partial [Thermodesulfobacteriota bacterium]
CRFWLDEYRLDGFRFDGVTSMLYLHHGLSKAFSSYTDYFNETVDEDALIYLALANRVIHNVRPEAVTIAEDVSGMPGLASSTNMGGIGFDFRLAMGIPDYWIRLIKDVKDENWPMGQLWFELINRRKGEKTISYAESHDQALVGDQTIIFRLIGHHMYDHMKVSDDDLIVDRGVSLHKLIRLMTIASADRGYLNFMGNEFGHPEWIDFPREKNNWSYKYARRQWSLADDPALKYHFLALFDRDMIALIIKYGILEENVPSLLLDHDADKVIAFFRSGCVFVFNFHPVNSYTDYRFEASSGEYVMIFNTDDSRYGGHGRLAGDQRHFTLSESAWDNQRSVLSLYLPSRTGLILKKDGLK